MSENCSTVEPWLLFSDAFAHETEAVTRALQISLSDDSSNSNSNSSTSLATTPSTSSSSALRLMKPEFQPESQRVKDPALSIQSSRVTKRKSRASKKTTTMFITADPANFRQMVQQATGVGFAVGSELPVQPVLKPEPQRLGSNRAGNIPHGWLPTLDTSAFFLDRTDNGLEPAVMAQTESAGCDFEPPFPSFPTLESWSVM